MEEINALSYMIGKIRNQWRLIMKHKELLSKKRACSRVCGGDPAQKVNLINLDALFPRMRG